MFTLIIRITSVTYITILLFIHPGCTLPDGPGKQNDHTLTEIYYFDIDRDSLHITFGHNSTFPDGEPAVEIKNSSITDRIMIVAEIKGRSGGKDPYIYKYIKFIDDYTLQFYISGTFIENPEKHISDDGTLAKIQTSIPPPRYYFYGIDIHKPHDVQVSYNFVNVWP